MTTAILARVSPMEAENAGNLAHLVRRYQSFLELSSEGIWCFEFDPPVPMDVEINERVRLCLERGRLSECNQALAEMYGYSATSEVLGTPLSWFLEAKNPGSEAYLRSFFQSRLRLINGETHEADQHGQPRVFLNNMMGMTESGKLVRVWGTQRDVTEFRRYEERLREIQKMEALGQLAGGVAHDLNNLLMVIGGNVSLAAQADGAGLQVLLEHAGRATESATDLTKKLLTFSRRAPMRLERIDVPELLQATTEMLRAVLPEGVDLDVEVRGAVAPILADRVAMEQMLVNLLVNARDSMPNGGCVRLVASRAEERHAGGSEGVLLEVSDTGHGIEPRHLPHIFEPFFTTKDGGTEAGTGLGLAIVHSVAMSLGGKASVASEIGRGTTFSVWLPAVAGAQESAAVEPGRNVRSRASQVTVLLVDDKEDVCILTQRYLEILGYSVLSARSADEALEASRLFTGVINLLLVDMAVGQITGPAMTGPDLVRLVRTDRPSVRVIFMCAGDLSSALADGSLRDVDVLRKPFRHDELANAVSAALRKGSVAP